MSIVEWFRNLRRNRDDIETIKVSQIGDLSRDYYFIVTVTYYTGYIEQSQYSLPELLEFLITKVIKK